MKSSLWKTGLTLDGAKQLGGCMWKGTVKGVYVKSSGNQLDVGEADKQALLFTPSSTSSITSLTIGGAHQLWLRLLSDMGSE